MVPALMPVPATTLVTAKSSADVKGGVSATVELPAATVAVPSPVAMVPSVFRHEPVTVTVSLQLPEAVTETAFT